MVGPIARGLACGVALALAPLLPAGCGAEGPEPRLETVSPGRAYTDRPRRLILRGEAFVPSFHVDLTTGQRTAETSAFRGWIGARGHAVPLTEFGWRSVNEISATLGPGLAPGRHPVVVVDPRGLMAELPAERGFLSLGEDRTPPTITVERPTPGTPMAAGGPIQAQLDVTDDGGLRELGWEIAGGGRRFGGSTCPIPPEATTVRCRFEVTVPRDLTAGQQIELTVTASDAAQPANPMSVSRSFTLGEAPSIALIVPSRGGSAGGTEVVIRGTRFLPGSRVFFGRVPLVPDGGLHLDERTITGRTPPHSQGAAEIRVVTPVGEGVLMGGFHYLAPPLVTAVHPAAGPAAGGTELRVLGNYFTERTRIYLGRTLRTAQPLGQPTLVSPGELRGVAPVGNGTVSVFAVDTEAGWGALTDAFSWTTP